MGITLSVAPTEEPVSLDDARLSMRVDDYTQDTLVQQTLVAARLDAEAFTGRVFITQTWVWTLDAFPRGAMRFPKNPVQSVTSVQYVDTAGATQTWGASKYEVTTDGIVAQLQPVFGESYPNTYEKMNAITVTFVAGYGGASAVPAGIKQAILMHASALYDGECAGGMGMVGAAKSLLWPYRILEL